MVTIDTTASITNTNTTASALTHVAAVGTNYGLLLFNKNADGFGSVPTTVTWGAAAMTLLGSQDHNNAFANGTVFIYGVVNPPTGSQTVTANFNAFTQSTSSVSISLSGVSSVGGLDKMFGVTGTPSHAMTCGAGQLIIHAFSNGDGAGGGGTFASPTGGTTLANVTNGFDALLVQSSLVSTTFAATIGATNIGAAGIVLSSPPTGNFFPLIAA